MYSYNKSGKKHLLPLQSAHILDQLRERIRYMHYSLRTEEAYAYWARALIRFHGLRHPREMGKVEIEAFLMALVSKRNVSSSTHRQALSSLLFLYGKVLGVDLPWLEEIGRPRELKRLPVTMSPDDAVRIFHQMAGAIGTRKYAVGKGSRSSALWHVHARCLKVGGGVISTLDRM